MRQYHTPSTVPENVRPEVVQGWNRLWNRLRHRSRQDRVLEFQAGTPLKISSICFSLRWVDHPERVPESFRTARMWVWVLRLGNLEREVPGACSFGSGKPHTYFDDLQAAVDEMIAISVMEE